MTTETPLPDTIPSLPDAVPARMVNEVLYCPRLMYLEWVQSEFRDNYFTVHGRSVHKRADHPGGSLPEPAVADGLDPEGQAQGGDPEPTVARSVWLTSERLGVTARIDIVEGSSDGVVIPIEYKRGRVPDVPERAYLPERAQLCTQVLLLREHGYTCDHAYIYFAGDRRRVTITVDDRLVATTLDAIARVRSVAAAPEPPPPLEDSPKCRGCSLVPICLPDEVHFLRQVTLADGRDPDGASRGASLASEDGPGGASLADEPALRRLHPARDDGLPLYVQEHGARIGVSSGCLRVTARTGDVVEARIPHTSQVSLFGYAQITTQALHALFRQQIPVSFFTGGGSFVGQAGGHASKNVELRVQQYRVADQPGKCLRLAAEIVASKIQNCRTLLRRNSDTADPQALKTLARQARRAGEAVSLAELLGIEGTAARVYFRAFSAMLKGESARLVAADFERRTRRPPLDPLNALLSFAYSLLTKDMSIALSTVGLDPMRGFYHQIRFGRPALALDLMEEFRPLIGDSVVVGVLNNGVIDEGDFDRSPVAVYLTSHARRRFLRAYERRMDQLVTHPVFGYRISYRRVLEVQARLLSRFLMGEIPSYPRFNTR